MRKQTFYAAGWGDGRKKRPVRCRSHPTSVDNPFAPVNLLYDLSLLGFCKDDPAKITGMPRVLIEQGTRLQQTPDCAVKFCAVEDGPEARSNRQKRVSAG